MMDEHISEPLPFDAWVFKIPKTLKKSIRAVKSELYLFRFYFIF